MPGLHKAIKKGLPDNWQTFSLGHLQNQPEVLQVWVEPPPAPMALTRLAAPNTIATPIPTMIAIPQDTLPRRAPMPITVMAMVARPLPVLPVNQLTTVQRTLPIGVSVA